LAVVVVGHIQVELRGLVALEEAVLLMPVRVQVHQVKVMLVELTFNTTTKTVLVVAEPGLLAHLP
jgi:hypothetical protein